MKNVLLTYGWVRSSYAVLRNLHAHGITVSVADSFRTGMSQWSRKKASFDLYPSHYSDEAGFIDAIVDICQSRDIDLIFPSHNETEILARHRERLPRMSGTLLPNSDHCALFNNKARAYDHARSCGVSVPLRIEYQNPLSISRLLETAQVGPTVIKLLTGNSGKGVFYASTPYEAQALVLDLIAKHCLTADRYPQVEERVEGEGWGVSVLFWQGQQVASFTHRRLREKIATGGTSTLREARPDPDLEAAATKLFTEIGWHGLAMAEFKRCPKTGRYWFIEVNPRLWGSLPLSVAAGVEFPYLAWLCVTEGPQAARDWQSSRRVQAGWRNRWLLGDALVFVSDLAKGRFHQAFEAIREPAADSFDDIFLDDPSVFAGEIVRYVSAAVRSGSLNATEAGMIG